MGRKHSIRPYSYRGKLFERRRDAEAYVEEQESKGLQSYWVIWGKGFKVYSGTVPRKGE